MLRWLIAAKAPSAIDRIEVTTMICCHCPTSSPNGPINTRISRAIAAIFGATAKNAVTGVGEPS